MNAVGIDVSKGKSTVAIMRPYGEIVASPFEITQKKILKSSLHKSKVFMANPESLWSIPDVIMNLWLIIYITQGLESLL